MEAHAVEVEELVGAWRSAFTAADTALAAASRDHDLSRGEIGRRSRALVDERSAAVASLTWLAEDRQERPLLVRLVSPPREARRLLGLPRAIDACIFNVDGVLVPSAALHAEAWKDTFDELLSRRIDRGELGFLPFSRRVDYPLLIHGRSREEAVREFLASRGMSLPEGQADDPPSAETVRGLANRKRARLLIRLEQSRVNPYAGARLYLQLAHDAGISCGVVSGSTHTRQLLESARLEELVDDLVDGAVASALGLNRKPAPDMLLATCRRLGARPSRAAVFETTADGVRAARAGEFDFVVGVAREGERRSLRESAPDLVVGDLGEMVESQISG